MKCPSRRLLIAVDLSTCSRLSHIGHAISCLERQGGSIRVYPYVLTCDERYLSIRAFTDNHKREAYEWQMGECVKCGKHFELGGMEGDHAKPWQEGGKTIAANCQMLCKDDNRRKSDV